MPQVTKITSTQTGESLPARSKGEALAALAELAAAKRRAGIAVSVVVWEVGAAVVEYAYERNGRRVEPGDIAVWYSDIEAKTGRCRRAVADAMRELRAWGWLAGTPFAPDPGNHWYRERGRYRVVIPRACSRLYARRQWAADRDEKAARNNAVAGHHEGHDDARPRVAGISSSLGDPPVTRENLVPGAPTGVDIEPSRPDRYPDEYWQPRSRLLAGKRRW